MIERRKPEEEDQEESLLGMVTRLADEQAVEEERRLERKRT